MSATTAMAALRSVALAAVVLLSACGGEQADFDRRHADCLEVEAEKRREGA